MKIKAIAMNTFREAVRDRVLYTLLIFGLVLIIASEVLSPLTLGQQEKIVKDVGLASISIFGLLIILFVGTGLLYKELDKRTIYTILSKPIYRYQFILGKFFGLLMTLFVIVAILTGGFYLYMWAAHHNPSLNLLNAIGLIYIKLAVITAVAIMFSAFSSPALSATLTFIVFFAGHLSADMKGLVTTTTPIVVKWAINFFYYLLPNLDFFDVKQQVIHGIDVSRDFYLFSTLYGISYMAAALLVAIIAFEQKDLK